MEYTFYKLSIGNKCYIGSTIEFYRRMSRHKYSCNNKNSRRYHLKVYQYIRDNGGWNDMVVMIIDKIIYNHKDEALDMETTLMLRDDAELNTHYPKRSQKEWYETNKQKILEKQKEKIPCDICSKMISRNWMTSHKKIKHPIIDENTHPF